MLLHLSTSSTEDFGMSVAQARQQGWPMILSDWGAFKEVRGPSVIHISASDISKLNSQKNRAKALKKMAVDLLKKMHKQENLHPFSYPVEKNEWVTYTDLEKLAWSDRKVHSLRKTIWSQSLQRRGLDKKIYKVLSEGPIL